MEETENRVARHYATGGIQDRIDAALTALGVDPAHPKADDLKPVDEFHTGGIEATRALLGHVEIQPGMHVLDIGAGLGGTARYVAHHYGARVTGIDLTDEFVAVAGRLNARIGLDRLIEIRQGSATAMPVEDGWADLALMFHVGMNIEDKQTLFDEVARVLKPGASFALFDVMAGENDTDPLQFPLPWAQTAETSFVQRPRVYREAASRAGLVHVDERERRDFALDYFARVARHIAAEGLPPLGIHLLMGPTAADKIANYVANVEARRIAPVEMIYQKAA